ncbi:MAG: metallophosphoesterase, partial [Nanoarchaeota archaeon]|nr:metallophosphoesterase [Nanoarchaeota archaeon]
IKKHTGKKIITKEVFEKNKESVGNFLLNLPKENQARLENLKIKMGLSIEISREESENVEESNNSDEIIPERKFIGKEPIKITKINKDLDGVKILSVNCVPGKKFGVDNFVDGFRGRLKDMKGVLQLRPELEGLVSLDKISGSRQGISIIGMVSDKKITKNKNILFEVEDLTGKIKVLVNQNKEELYAKAEEVALDSVVGFKCSGNKEILFANDIIFPDCFLFDRKKSPEEECVAFIGDIHYGSKNFMAKEFLRFIDYLNGKLPGSEEAKKIKYLFIVGDLVTGIGNYPNQERDLQITDLEDQFTGIAGLLGKIRKDIKIIISPGNHEGVRLIEPQPLYDEKYAWALYDMENVILTENPVSINIGAKKSFSGFDVLVYHGFSFPFYANNVARLMKSRAMNCPEEIMKYLLKHRHLAPTHGSVQYFPGERDVHFIKDVPDIFVSGHTHKSAITHHNNILVISVSSWETLTPYQEKFGNEPDHCKVPLLNLKTRTVKVLDFE